MMKQRKKNSFFTFLCSFIPGAAEMYMGFMKMGLSIMTIFVLSVMFPIIFSIEIFLCITILVWFYAFFHARNIATCDEETFAKLQDNFIWSEFVNVEILKLSNSFTKLIAITLIIFGVGGLLNNFMNMIYKLIPDRLWNLLYPIVSSTPKIFFSIVLIVIGVKMIKGKKEEINGK